MKQQIKEKKDRRRAKKILLIVAGGICAFILIFFGVSRFISSSRRGDKTTQSNNYRFDYANYDENIFLDKKYMSYDRSIYYTGVNTYMTVTIDREHMDDVSEIYREPVLFLMDYIDAMINGDVAGFNACHAPEYYTGGRQPKENFTMQKLYSITLISVDNWYDDSDSDAERYYNIGIEYMIKNNNGTLRNDMGSDAIRRKYLTIKETSDGDFSITDESYFSSLEQNQ